MKKIFLFLLGICIFIGAYAFYQNKGRFFLILLAQHRFSNPFQSFGSAKSSGSKPLTYKNGTYTGISADAFYGNIQAQVTIQKEKITSIRFLQYPNDALRSQVINSFAMPNLEQEVIQAQSSNVDIVSGATASSQAFIQSLNSALIKAKNA